jgi:hypothetical protein
MRRLLTLLYLCLSVAALHAQLRVDAETKDFGRMRPLERRTLSFSFTNAGPDTLHLGDPRPSCGCTAVLLDRRVLAPGDSGHLEVSFHAGPGSYGTSSKTITLLRQRNGGEEQLAVLRVRAEVIGDIIYEPSALELRGEVGRTDTLRVRLISNTDSVLRLDNISVSLLAYVDTSADDVYHAERVVARPFTGATVVTDGEDLDPRRERQLLLILTPVEKGQLNGAVRIALPRSEVRIPVTGVVLRPPARASP